MRPEAITPMTFVAHAEEEQRDQLANLQNGSG